MSAPGTYHGWTAQGKGRVGGQDWDLYVHDDLVGWVSPRDGKFRAVAQQFGGRPLVLMFDTLDEAKRWVGVITELES